MELAQQTVSVLPVMLPTEHSLQLTSLVLPPRARAQMDTRVLRVPLHQPAPSPLPLVLLTADGKLLEELLVQHVLLERVHLLLAPRAQQQLTLDTPLLELHYTLALLLEHSLEAPCK